MVKLEQERGTRSAGRNHSRVAVSRTVFALSFIIILVVSGLALVFFDRNSPSGNSSTTSGKPLANVTVFGLASTTGHGTHLVELDFTNAKTGATFTAPVPDGNFSIGLPNGAIYKVTAKWAGNYSWQSGAEDRGDLTVNMSAGSIAAMPYNLQLETPLTLVAVQGTVNWTLTSAHPIRVVYTASDGESFEAPVQNATFSTRLPNMMEYQVKVFWQYADGTTDYLFAANQTINEGNGIVGVLLSID
jgi:hypothetical protein